MPSCSMLLGTKIKFSSAAMPTLSLFVGRRKLAKIVGIFSDQTSLRAFEADHKSRAAELAHQDKVIGKLQLITNIGVETEKSVLKRKRSDSELEDEKGTPAGKKTNKGKMKAKVREISPHPGPNKRGKQVPLMPSAPITIKLEKRESPCCWHLAKNLKLLDGKGVPYSCLKSAKECRYRHVAINTITRIDANKAAAAVRIPHLKSQLELAIPVCTRFL